jgi:NADPH-dependent curcumin reductase CurA
MRQNRRRDPRTTSTWSPSADGWKASSCSITCRAGEAIGALTHWVQAGKIKTKVDVQDGLENAPATLGRLFEGRNEGKQLLLVAE